MHWTLEVVVVPVGDIDRRLPRGRRGGSGATELPVQPGGVLEERQRFAPHQAGKVMRGPLRKNYAADRRPDYDINRTIFVFFSNYFVSFSDFFY